MLSEWVWTSLEAVAVASALAYLLLAVKQRLSCWYAAAISVTLYLVIFYFHARLLFDALLQVYYLGMAYYGYKSWLEGADSDRCALRITSWPLKRHLIIILAIGSFSFIAGTLAQTYTDAKLPILDAATTLAGIFATWLVVRKVLENWIYWIVIDTASIYLYFDRGLYLTVLLFILYTLIALFGWITWRSNYRLAQ